MVFKDYYKILGLETSRVSVEDIKLAYRAAAKKYHPDLNVGDNLAETRIKDINEAYRVLSDASSKKKYDRMWNSNMLKNRRKFKEEKDKTKAIFSDFFYMFFGNVEEKETKQNLKSKLPIKGENIETEINVALEEAFFGLSKKIVLKNSNGGLKSINVSIPEGIKNGEKIRLIGQGKTGENGGKNGDLIIKILIKNEGKFKLKGNDLYTDLFISPWEAALGTRTIVKSIDEDTKVYIPQGIQTGERLRIPEKGYKKQGGGRGDLVAEIKIVIPKNLSKEEKLLFEKLKKVSNFEPGKLAKR